MRETLHRTLFLSLLGLLIGCAGTEQINGTYQPYPAAGATVDALSLDSELQKKILAMDPERVTNQDIEQVLSQTPAPRILNIRGGIYSAHIWMIDFSKFLIGMGYPEDSLRHPLNGEYSYSSYGSSVELAGTVAWHYEREGLRPMIVGHSLGGIEAVKVLYRLAGDFEDNVSVYNPMIDQTEGRYTIVDPLTNEQRPVVGLSLSYVAVIGAGGVGLLWPNQWEMSARLRSIPDTVEEFTAFHILGDPFGGDLLGIESNRYLPSGKAIVRNVALPSDYNHVSVIYTEHLIESQEISDWINNDYVPSEQPEIGGSFESSTENILYAADVWHSIKKHWVLELQRLIKATQLQPAE